MVHGGNDISDGNAVALREKRKNVKDVVFLLNITTIGHYACLYCVSLVTVVVPEGIESIGDFAFFYCTSLLNVTFPKSLKSIGEYAFWNCSELKSLKLPSSVQSAGVYAFYYCLKLVPSTISTSYDYDNAPILAFLHKPQSERDALMLANPPSGEDSEDSDVDDDEGDY
jgi:hypothetical protein